MGRCRRTGPQPFLCSRAGRSLSFPKRHTKSVNVMLYSLCLLSTSCVKASYRCPASARAPGLLARPPPCKRHRKSVNAMPYSLCLLSTSCGVRGERPGGRGERPWIPVSFLDFMCQSQLHMRSLAAIRTHINKISVNTLKMVGK